MIYLTVVPLNYDNEALEEHKANLLDEGVPTFNKVIRNFKFNPPPE